MSEQIDQLCGGPGDHFMCGCITGHVRDVMRHFTGTNCTFADDDVTALGILADRAIRAGLHRCEELPDTMIADIDERIAQRIEARSDETLQAARPEGQEPDGEADAPSPSPLVGEQ